MGLIWNSHHSTFQTKEEVVLVINDTLDNVETMMKASPTCGRCGVFETWHDDEVDGHEFEEMDDAERDRIRKAMRLTV